jgi:hypothetical protein
VLGDTPGVEDLFLFVARESPDDSLRFSFVVFAFTDESLFDTEKNAFVESDVFLVAALLLMSCALSLQLKFLTGTFDVVSCW